MATRNGTAAAAEEERKATRRVVLRRERALLLPASVTSIDAAKLAEALGIPKAEATRLSTYAEAWVVVGEFEGQSKTKAIEAHAGKPGTPDAKVGAFKAPSVTSWTGGEEYEAPPEPLVQRRALAD